MHGRAVREVVAAKFPGRADSLQEDVVHAVILHATYSAAGRRFPEAADAGEWVVALAEGHCNDLVVSGQIDDVGRTITSPARAVEEPAPAGAEHAATESPILEALRDI